jgi:deoxyribose-phosphate aldolase
LIPVKAARAALAQAGRMDAPAPTTLRALAARLLPLLDLTSLGEDDSPARIEALCDAACTPFGKVAAVCVYPEHITTARRRLGDAPVRVVSVVNFPDGGECIARVVGETRRALAAGADEIDMVLPYRALLRGDTVFCADLVRSVREVCGSGHALKLIVESGELADPGMLRRACTVGLEAGVDFLKTSTGKVPVNATVAASRVMLQAIRQHGGRCGFKAAGGIRSLDDAASYLALADDMLGPDWATASHFRIGASALLDAVLAELGPAP